MSWAAAGNCYGPSFVGGDRSLGLAASRVSLLFVTGSGSVPSLQSPCESPLYLVRNLPLLLGRSHYSLTVCLNVLGVLQPGLMGGCPWRWPQAPSLADQS